MTTPHIQSATQLANAIEAGRTSASEVLSVMLARIDTCNTSVNAIVSLDRERALERARQADAALARGERWGPLHGVPFTVKDSFRTAGLRSTCGHPPLSNNIPNDDAAVVERLHDAGGVLLGKTNLPEFAVDIQCENPLFGRTENPWKQGRTSGGSSGGEAVAVSMGMTGFGIGSDIGGSLRLPAHYCGVYALKPTEGRVSNRGHIFPGEVHSVHHLAATGPIARHPADLALVLQAIEEPPPPHLPARTPGPLRVCYSTRFDGAPVQREVASAIDAFLGRLSDSGVELEPVEPSGWSHDELWQVYGELFGVMAFANASLPQRLAARALGPALVRDPISKATLRAAFANPRRYFALLERKQQLGRAVEQSLRGFDAWVSPVSCSVAPPHRKMGKIHTPIRVDDTSVPGNLAGIAYTAPFNLLGLPVVTAPLTIDSEGLPIGVQLAGHRWRDLELVHLLEALSASLGGYVEPPGLAA